jgi:diketogulonate reductase-like aldo/keto reductase
LRQPNAVAIPKTVNVERLEENLVASHIQLDLKTLESLDAIFLPPTQKSPLMVI